jgi:uncharacterized Ntn-hydrolase superfamily protein
MTIYPSTFSIVAYDPGQKEWGVATQSKFLAVGAVVPWARAGMGAVATQSYANTTFGPKGLELMAAGVPAQQALDRLLEEDAEREHRQVGLVDKSGHAATFTGKECLEWAGGVTGESYAVQGNILVSGATIVAMAEAFEQSGGELADRLVAALAAGQQAGGDRRGQQSAAVLVVREQGGYAGFNDRYIDLRVDDDSRPIERLQEILRLHHLFFGKPDPATLLPIDEPIARELQRIAQASKHYTGSITGEYDEATRQAVETLVGVENLEDRWPLGEARIDPIAFEFLQQRYPAKAASPGRSKRRPASKKRTNKKK